MKKIFKSFILLLCSFMYIYEVNAEDQDLVCDGQEIHYLTNEYTGKFEIENSDEVKESISSYNDYINSLHNFEWNVYVKVPKCNKVETKYSQCQYKSEDLAKYACYDTVTTKKTHRGNKNVGYAFLSSKRVYRECSDDESDVSSGILCGAVCTGQVLKYGSYYCSGGSICDSYFYETDCLNATCSWTRDSSWQNFNVTIGGEQSDELDKDKSLEQQLKELKYSDNQIRNVNCEGIYKTSYKEYSDCSGQPYEVKGIREFMYTTVGDSGDNIPVYCVNPDDKPIKKANVEEIDATKCESSNSTLECGFSNIMIEGYYRNMKGNSNYNTKVVNLAMRIWATHVGYGGFDKVGIADEDDSTINSVYKWITFYPTSTKVVNGEEVGVYDNIYKQARKSILENIFYYDFTTASDLYEVDTTVGKENGLLEYKCSSINPNNKKEIDNDLYGVICSSSDYKSNTYIYAYYLFINTVQGNPYMQEHFDEINMDASGITDKTEIEDNGPSDASVDVIDDTTIQVIYRLEKGVEIDCNTLDEDTQNDLGCRVIQTVIIKDKNGNQISADIDSYDYCKKNYCYKEIKVDAGKVTCDKTDRIIIKTQRERSCGSKSVKRYTSCGSSTGTQIMYSFEADENCNEDSKVTEEIETFLNCEPCNINSRVVKPTCDGKNTDGIATGMAGDPSLNCILHKTSFNDENATGDMPTDASYYDYSDIFNVNTNICRVYCSDRVEYYLPDKQSATNGLQLKYDIESRVFKDRTDDEKSVHSLTSVVMVKRDCVSEIFYDDVSFDYYKDWKTAYGLSEQPYNWRELYDMLTETSKNEASRTEVLNDLIYDLYNCNLFANGDIPSTIKKSKDKVLVLDSAKKLLDNSKSYCSGESCVNGSVVYEGGAKYIEAQDSYYFTGQNGVDPALTSEVKVYDDINLRYCNKNECFRGADAGDDFPEDYDAAKTSSSFENVKFNGKNVNVPSNDYAIFSYTLEADLYNSTRYQVEQHTGNVEVVKNNEFKDEYLTLNEYVYPIASSVNNVCDAIKSDSNNNSVINYVCDISYSISPIIYSKVISERTAFTRKSTSDDFLRNIGEVQNFACEYDVNRTPDEPDDCPASDPSCTSLITNGSEMFVFKNIDLENPFPVKRTGTNWDGNQGTEYSNYVSKVINEIKESGKNDLYATDEYLEYSYVLTPTAIESIRVYNSGHSYSDKTYNCTIEDNKFFNCKSEFLDYLHEDSNPTGIIINKSDGKSQHSEEAE